MRNFWFRAHALAYAKRHPRRPLHVFWHSHAGMWQAKLPAVGRLHLRKLAHLGLFTPGHRNAYANPRAALRAYVSARLAVRRGEDASLMG